ncbi:MFS transporter [Pseudomonas sp. REB1044]|uniref:MFS transporter n=1 Tax=Pseudomonas sp. REB1044 TaxID=2675224 RepID=UPI00315DE74F
MTQRLCSQLTSSVKHCIHCFLAFCCGATAANIYYAQPILGLIAPDLEMGNYSSIVVSLTQLGFSIGLLFLVPLADIIENRRLIIIITALNVTGLILAGISKPGQTSLFLSASVIIGFSSVVVQILIPMATHLTPEHQRGRVVGNIMSGLLVGILLSRPLSSFITDNFNWRSVFLMAATLMSAIVLLLFLLLPSRRPAQSTKYTTLLYSMPSLLLRYSVLRRRALYQGLLFASFSLYWSAVPLVLTREFGLTQSQVGIFALIGAIGAVAAPIAGRLADAGHSYAASLLALVIAPLALVSGLLPVGSSLLGLALTGVLLDFAVQMNMIVSQREVYILSAENRGRLNALYMTSLFLGGAAGSAIASNLYLKYGWHGVILAAVCLPTLALILFLSERFRSNTRE